MSQATNHGTEQGDVEAEQAEPGHDAWFKKKVAEALADKEGGEPYTSLDEAMKKLGW